MVLAIAIALVAKVGAYKRHHGGVVIDGGHHLECRIVAEQLAIVLRRALVVAQQDPVVVVAEEVSRMVRRLEADVARCAVGGRRNVERRVGAHQGTEVGTLVRSVRPAFGVGVAEVMVAAIGEASCLAGND